MGMWSNLNKRENFRDGKEDYTANYRSQLRNGGGSTEEDDLPDTRRTSTRMSRADRKAADKILKQGKPARKPRR